MRTLCKERELAEDLINWQAKDFTGKPKYRWKYIGEGAYRIAYRGPDGMIYKIPVELEDEYIGENEREFSNWKRIVQLPDFSWQGNTWKVPQNIQLFTFPHIGYFDGYHASVITMPFIKGKTTDGCICDCGAEWGLDCIEFDQANTYYGLIDCGNDNMILLPDNTRVLIDMQC